MLRSKLDGRDSDAWWVGKLGKRVRNIMLVTWGNELVGRACDGAGVWWREHQAQDYDANGAIRWQLDDQD